MDKLKAARAKAAQLLDLEFQYSPSRWSKRLDPDSVIATHVALTTAASQKAKQNVSYEILRYGPGDNQLIDLYGVTLPKDSPILVYIHGGYWQDLRRTISAYIVEPLFQSGVAVAVVGYDLAPKVTLERIIEEMVELDVFLTKWAAEKGVKTVWYAGHSAGAYLIGTILKERAENPSSANNISIGGMIFISGIYDLRPLLNTYINEKLRLSRSESTFYSLRNIQTQNLTNVKFLIVIAENDSDEYKRQSTEFCGMLRENNNNVEFLTMNGRDHFDVVEKLSDGEYELTRKIISLITTSRSRG